MRETYHYKDYMYPVADDTDINFTVNHVSEGNVGLTVIKVPGPNEPEIDDSGTKFIGKGRDLRGYTTICVTDVTNLVSTEDEIRIRYMINGKLIKEHYNPKSKERTPLIILSIDFPEIA